MEWVNLYKALRTGLGGGVRAIKMWTLIPILMFQTEIRYPSASGPVNSFALKLLKFMLSFLSISTPNFLIQSRIISSMDSSHILLVILPYLSCLLIYSPHKNLVICLPWFKPLSGTPEWSIWALLLIVCKMFILSLCNINVHFWEKKLEGAL